MELFLDAQMMYKQESPSTIQGNNQTSYSQESITPESSISQKTPQEFFTIDGCLADVEMENSPLGNIRKEKRHERTTRRRDKKELKVKVEKENKKSKRQRKTRELPVLQSQKIATGRITLKKGVFEKGKSSVQRSLGFNENQFLQNSYPNVKEELPLASGHITEVSSYQNNVKIPPDSPNQKIQDPKESLISCIKQQHTDLERILRSNLDPIINELDFYIPMEERIIFE